MPVSIKYDIEIIQKSTNHSLSLNANFTMIYWIKMPYDEVCFQRLEEDHPEDYEKLKSKKSS